MKEAILTSQAKSLFKSLIDRRISALQIYNALGWKGGTWESAIAEIKRLKKKNG